MNKNSEFYVGYLEHVGPKTKRAVKRFVIVALAVIVLSAIIFSLSQKPFKNSSFELVNTSKITGTYHESPYPMLRVKIADNTFKNILLLGFGKSSANPFLENIKQKVKELSGKTLSIEGNLIYYNGKTLLQISDNEKITLEKTILSNEVPLGIRQDQMTLEGEVIDPKCYFGVMKPGKGKIHRSCAVRCISGGIPPVYAIQDSTGYDKYYLITDQTGNPINESILQYIGKPSKIKGTVEEFEDWDIFKINVKNIKLTGKKSTIY